MPETTPLIKAALNLRGGAGFDVYLETKISPENISVHLSLSKVPSDIYLALASFSKYVPSPILPV